MEGDYVAHIHQYVKYKIKTVELETGQRYQYPRRHRFQALVGNLIALGLVEKTGRQEDPQERGAATASTRRPFSRRTWIRPTLGSSLRPEWADPRGYVALQHPGIRPEGKQPTAAVPEGPPSPAPRRRPTRRAAGGPSAEVVAQLDEERKRVGGLVMAVATRGSTVAHFQRACDELTSFMGLLAQHYRRAPFPRVAEDLPLLRNCITLLQEEPLTRSQRATRLGNCESSARVLADALQAPLAPPGPEEPAPETPRPRLLGRPRAATSAPGDTVPGNGAPEPRRRRVRSQKPPA